jgi:hypothetical protein
MTKPLGYYTNYDPQKPSGCLHELQLKYGVFLESMSQNRKRIFRAALADYLSNLRVWIDEGSSCSCMEAAIESAGVNWNIWDEDPGLCVSIQNCEQLEESDIEGLILALTYYIREGIN